MNKRLLMADGNETARRVVELTFQGEGMMVTSVADGTEALAQIEREAPDIVLVDIGIPGRDGYEIASFVKRRPGLEHVPVVLLTSQYAPVDHDRVRAIGCDGVLTKPLEADVVLSMVRNLCADPGIPGSPVQKDAGGHHDFPWPPEADSSPGLEGAPDYPFEVSPSASTANGSIDDYLDRLDEALDQAGRSPAAPPSRPPIVEAGKGSTQAAAPAGSTPGKAGPEGPTLAEAFAALLAAERGAVEPASASTPTVRPHVLEPSDALVDEITKRVLGRLTDRVIREEVSARVLEVADRLVRDEIERIKASTRQSS